jgi:hypothetical protein
MSRTPTFPIYDRILGGRLAVLLLRWRGEGLSHRSIAGRLADEHDIHVTYKTVGRWLDEIEGPGAA